MFYFTNDETKIHSVSCARTRIWISQPSIQGSTYSEICFRSVIILTLPVGKLRCNTGRDLTKGHVIYSHQKPEFPVPSSYNGFDSLHSCQGGVNKIVTSVGCYSHFLPPQPDSISHFAFYSVFVSRGQNDSVAVSVQSLSRGQLCDPMDYSMLGFPVHHQLPELTQTHVHPVSDAIQPSHPLSSPLLSSIFPSIRVFSSESVIHIRWPEYWSFSFSISPSNEYSGLISFRMNWQDILAIQGTLKSLLQYHG